MALLFLSVSVFIRVCSSEEGIVKSENYLKSSKCVYSHWRRKDIGDTCLKYSKIRRELHLEETG